MPSYLLPVAGLLAFFGAMFFYGESRFDDGANSVQVKFDAYKIAIQKNNTEMLAQRAKIKEKQADAIAKLDEKYMGELLDERENTDSIIANIRTIRVQPNASEADGNCGGMQAGSSAPVSTDDGQRERRFEKDRQLAIEAVETLGLCRERVKQLNGLKAYTETITGNKK